MKLNIKIATILSNWRTRWSSWESILKKSPAFMEYLDSVSVWDGNMKLKEYSKEQLSNLMVRNLIKETLDGKWNKIIIKLRFQRAGTFVKRLNKTVYKTTYETMVLHNAKSGMALLFLCPESLRCHKLISNFQLYCFEDLKNIRDLTLGSAEIPEYVVHQNRKAIEGGIKTIVQEIETVNERLSDSENWSTEISAGMNNFHKMSVKVGAEEA